MSAGATDGSFLRNAGIPTYGHSGLASDVNDGGRAHGKDERVLIKSFYQGEDYLYRLVKMLSGGSWAVGPVDSQYVRRSPDGAERNPGSLLAAPPACAALHSGYRADLPHRPISRR